MEIILSFIFIVLIFCHHSFAQPGFLSLDCGGRANYIDSAGIHWMPDDSFVNGGAKVRLQAAPFGSHGSIQLTTQRTFPHSLKKCYVFGSLDTTAKYLVRATFAYSNHGNPPVFQLILDANIWDTISFQNTSRDLIVKEVVAMPKPSGIINVCLGRGQIGVPFISSLELRTLNPQMYGLVNQSYSLLKLQRTDFGSSKNSRYPNDPYDRIWDVRTTNFRSISSYNTVSLGKVPDQPPSLVMRTAQTSLTQSPLRIDLRASKRIKNGYLYLSMYFAELEKLNASSIREFDVYLDNNLYYGGLQPKYLEATNVSLVGWYGITKTNSFVLRATNRSNVSPLLNALEIYRRSEKLVEGTVAQDVEGIRKIQQQFELENFGDGDPCLPVSYSWEWLACNNDISPRITSLNLSSKGLIGTIPSSISLLSALVNIDLSNNHLSGSVDDFLSKLRNLKELNLENNNFSGVLPDSLENLSIRIAGNLFLCQSSQNCSRSGGNGNKVLINVLIIAGVVVFLCVSAVVLERKTFAGFFLKKIPENPKEIDTSKCIEFTYNEIIEITSRFQNKIGLGGFGAVYKGQLQNGREVAGKVLSEKSKQGAKEFSREVTMLSRVHHKNLVSLLGYCCESHNQILVYEYMDKGDLRQLLHGSQEDEDVLSWKSRLDIALNAAQGLEYLHSGCKPPIIHRDVKTANILLSERMGAKIADFGLSRDGPSTQVSHVSTDVKGTPGYLDPEYYNTRNLTEKSDVYSFGVVLLELISGRPVIFDVNGEATNITEWARKIKERSNNMEGILDPRMAREEMNMNMKDAMRSVAELGMECTERQGKERRPSMNYVVMELKRCTQMLSGDGDVIQGQKAEGGWIGPLLTIGSFIQRTFTVFIRGMNTMYTLFMWRNRAGIEPFNELNSIELNSIVGD